MNNAPKICRLSKAGSLSLKGIAICAMLCHHLFTCVPRSVGLEYSGLPLFLGQIGKCCVAIFVLVSGYGLSIGYESIQGPIDACKYKGYISYLVKRFVHFYLQYWPIFLIFVPIGVFVFHRPLSVSYAVGPQYLFKHLVYDILGLQGFQSYNETWWFNKLIIYLYILSPFVYYLVKKACVPALVFFLLLLRFGHHLPFDLFFVDSYGLPFVFGMSLYVYRNTISSCIDRLPRWILCLVPFIIIGVSIVFRRTAWLHMGGIRADAFIALGFSLLVMVYNESFDKLRLLSLLGKHSANIYMIHTFIFHRWFAESIYGLKYPLLIFLVLLFVCLALSVLIEWLKRTIGIYQVQTIIDNKLV